MCLTRFVISIRYIPANGSMTTTITITTPILFFCRMRIYFFISCLFSSYNSTVQFEMIFFLCSCNFIHYSVGGTRTKKNDNTIKHVQSNGNYTQYCYAIVLKNGWLAHHYYMNTHTYTMYIWTKHNNRYFLGRLSQCVCLICYIYMCACLCIYSTNTNTP